jgi:cytidylate kinase
MIIVSGPPASGKSTLARDLAAELGLVVIDKDDFLECHLATHASFSADRRQQSSRSADREFEEAARQVDSAILVSHWRHPGSDSQSGTPSEWLREFDDVVEIFCLCSPLTAVQRFQSRDRHPGHGDSRWSRDEQIEQFENYVSLGPLGVGRLIVVNTEQPIDTADVAGRCTTT